MSRRYGFNSREEAEQYASKNFNTGSYEIFETNQGRFGIRIYID